MMKRTLLRTLLLLLLASLLLSSCSKIPELDYSNGSFVNEKSGVSYLAAPLNYKARNYLENGEIAKIPYKKTEDMILYSIDKVDSEKYLTNTESQLFYNSTLKLPALWEMQTEKVNVVTVAEIQHSIVSITEEADIAAIVNAYQNGVHFSHDEISVELTPKRYDLEFASPLYPAFYYVLTYWSFQSEVLVYEVIESTEGFVPSYEGIEVSFETFEDETYAVYHFGKHLVYDRETGECYPIGDAVAKHLA